MSNITVRRASKKDVPSIVPLMLELGYPTAEEDLAIRFTRFMSKSGYGVAVCELDGLVVGFIAWSRSGLFVVDAVRFHVEAICVASQHKHKGVGKKLMEFVEEVARKNAPAIVDLTSGIRRAKDGAHQFYNGLGYKNEGLMAKAYLRKEFTA